MPEFKQCKNSGYHNITTQFDPRVQCNDCDFQTTVDPDYSPKYLPSHQAYIFGFNYCNCKDIYLWNHGPDCPRYGQLSRPKAWKNIKNEADEFLQIAGHWFTNSKQYIKFFIQE